MARLFPSLRRRPGLRRTRRRGRPEVPRYELIEQVGGGTLCRVFLARERPGGATRAVKLLRTDWGDRPEALRFLRQEAEVAQIVRHPNLVVMHESRLGQSPPFLVLEWLAGRTVDSLLAQQGRIAVPKAIWIARQAASALAALNQAGYLHGDVKPGNLFLTDEGWVKLIDLGFARRIGEAPAAGMPLVGTANYLAPERTLSHLPVDAQSDLYSLGVTLYEMLTGELPFPPGDLAETIRHQRHDRPHPLLRRRPGLPPELVRLIEVLLAKEPLRRPASAVELMQQLTTLELATFHLR